MLSSPKDTNTPPPLLQRKMKCEKLYFYYEFPVKQSKFEKYNRMKDPLLFVT